MLQKKSCSSAVRKLFVPIFALGLSLFEPGSSIFATNPEQPIAIRVNANSAAVLHLSESATPLHLTNVVLEQNSSLELPPFKSVFIENLIAKNGAKIKIAKQNSGADASANSGKVGLTGAKGADGGDGGNARIFLRRVSGHLIVESRGGDGARGGDGTNGRQGADGKRGRNARTLFFGLIYLEVGGRGLPGEPGENGTDGGSGGNAGRGGTVSVYYEEKSADAEIALDVSGGRGGMPGEGGTFGIGGNGGPGGSGLRKGLQGPLGPSGLPGHSGNPGQPGKPGISSVYQLSSSLFTCLSRLEIRNQLESLQASDFNSCRDLQSAALNSGPVKPIIVVSGSSFFPPQALSDHPENILQLAADGEDGVSALDSRGDGTKGLDGSSASSGGSLTVVLRDIPSEVILSAKGGNGGSGAEDPLSGGNGGAGGHGGNIRVIYIPTALPDEGWFRRIFFDVRGGPGGLSGLNPSQSGYRGTEGNPGDDGTIEFYRSSSLTDWIVGEFETTNELFHPHT
jgi:hypothetical protein